MNINIVKSKDGKDYNNDGEEVITCELCKKNKTTMTGTKRCDLCWSLEHKITANPELARHILQKIDNSI